ncbi:MAG: NADH-quinone oxidoreductase subunit M [Candidatus Dormibacteraeota bacterium]|nr:NADH-quinone oxidoreductase subunit M [Candidatus Dormibacteraeota bacterium]
MIAELHLLLAASPTPAPTGAPTGIPSPGATATATPSPLSFGAGIVNFSFLLSALVWIPFLTAIVVALLPPPRRGTSRRHLGVAFWVNLLLLVITVIAYSQFSEFSSGLQFNEQLPWFPDVGIHYHLGVSGTGMGLLVLSGFVGVAGCLAAYNLRDRQREFFVLLLLTQWAVNGAIAAQDAVLLVFFFAAAAIPLALLAGGWSAERRWRAAGRFAAYWLLGSAALLLAVLLLVTATGGHSFQLSALSNGSPTWQFQLVIAILVLIACATRLPIVPLHGWVREMLAEAPPAVALLLMGAASRIGASVLLELLVGPLHWAAQVLSPVVAGLAALTVVWAAVGAIGTRDLRRLAAYLSMVPGGLTLLGVAGLTPLALQGVQIMLFAGGLASAVTVGVGLITADHLQVRNLANLGGVASRLPRLTWLLVGGVVATLGIPFMATFPAFAMIVLGSFYRQPVGTVVVLAALVVAAAACALLLRRVLFGPRVGERPNLRDASLSEVWAVGILIAALLWVGILPGGPKVAGISIFDPGFVNILSQNTSTISAPYVQASPPPSPSPSPSPSPPAGASPTPTPNPTASPS